MNSRRFHRWFSLILLGLAAGCGCLSARIVPVPRDAVSAASATAGPYPLTPRGRATLQGYIRAAELSALRWSWFRRYQAPTKKFYLAYGEALPWIGEQGRPSPQALSTIQLLKDAENKGLRPEDYDSTRWDDRLTRLSQAKASEEDLIRFDLALTVSAMRYISDLRSGRVDPRRLDIELGVRHKRLDLSQFLQQKIVSAPDVSGAMETIEPSSSAYRRALSALKTYLDLARRDDGERLPVPRRTIEPGDTYPGLPRLIRLLALLGDLPPGAEKPGPRPIYEGTLVDAVKHFQARHGLEADGRLGRRTLKQLNTPLGRRVVQLQLALERWRWVPAELTPPYIAVNIPEFDLHGFNPEHHKVVSMKVVVGKAYGHETPVFLSTLTSVIFRPYWNVPLEIQLEELLPEIEKNPSYLEEHRYEVVDSAGNVVSEGPVSNEIAEQLRAGNLAIRQKPGPDDALGLIKFEFPNLFGVYMHGTPATVLFSRSRRDFSHGCIRVEDPVALAAWVLRDTPGWDLDGIRAAMNGEKTIRANPEKRIPVLIVYTTAVATEEGEVHFFEDIYGQDAELESALQRSHPDSR
jgi:L,D-transpeptidase YcbB